MIPIAVVLAAFIGLLIIEPSLSLLQLIVALAAILAVGVTLAVLLAD